MALARDFGLWLCIRARFQSCRSALKKNWASAPAMAIPDRNANSGIVLQPRRTFFVTTRTQGSRRLFQVDRNAELLVDVLRSCMRARRFQVLDFVVMPDHVHLLMTVDGSVSIEKAMQFVKGGFSYRLKKELGHEGEVWQRGFSEVRVNDEESLQRHRAYIAQNPVRAGFVKSAELFPWSFESLKRRKGAGAEARSFKALNGTTEVVP
jgi:putative transposase